MTIYRERVWPSPWIYVSTSLVIPASLIVFLPINFMAGVIVAIVLYASCVAILIATAPKIAVTGEHFVAGRAKLPLRFVGTVEFFRGEEATLARGRQLDSRAWLLIRGWVDPVVRVEVLDKNDPTPYWVVSTRHPEELVAAIATARAAA